MTHAMSVIETMLLVLGLAVLVLIPAVIIWDWISGIRYEEQEQERLKSRPCQYDG